ncbi:TPA: hypothetical protein DIV49_02315 [Candidatus Saccharibacteria bacterium]|nr:hypothetical protein [Candidatus Saccharibacteria bacterium]HRJ90995.1 DUF305 domain-containing protein [Candidatus Saccharibacteria bacterium]
MQTKPLLYGLIGFFLGGLLVAIAATTFNKPEQETRANTNSSMSSMSMDDMTADLKNKTGDEFDKAFIASMIAHHEGAVEMAKLSAKNAKHEEVKTLSNNIITAQEKEIAEMKQWQMDWGYSSMMMDHGSMSH